MEFDTHDNALETKAVTSADASSLYDDMMRTFDALKANNDEQLASIRRHDALLDEKAARIDQSLTRKIDELTLKSARPHFGADTAARGAYARASGSLEHKAAFESYVRSGESAGLRALETKAMSVGSNPDGGYLVPSEVETVIGERLAAISPIRAISGVRTVSANVYKKPFMTSGPAVGWVGETDTPTTTTSPTLAELSFPAMELYAMPAATATLLEDSAVNIDQWLAAEVDQAFAVQEGAAFVNGDGSNKPTGFLHQTIVAESAWAWGKLGYIATGSAGAFSSTGAVDPLIDLVYALKAGYRQNGTFVMNRRTQSAIRKLKDEDGQYLWSPPVQGGGRSTLLNYPVVEAEDMPDIAANAYALAFGDFARGYLVVDRAGVRVLRDPYSAKPYVLFYTTKRVGGGVQDFDAIKLLKFAAS
jgi:HK97 family phage major capsid protein